jgi:ParB-like chromosome segregation protein Spo0J
LEDLMPQHKATLSPGLVQDGIPDGDPSAWLFHQLTECPIDAVPISSLKLDATARNDLVNIEHVQVLAGISEDLPPIVVHEPSRRVIDGIHRVRAALLRGWSHIPAKMYTGLYEDAFAVAVKLNTTHGLPLSRAERSTAAGRILRTHPQWSNRMIAGIAGLSESTIRALRHACDPADDQPLARIGRDGRARPVNTAHGRMVVSRLLAERPTASAREIAKAAGVSANTVLNVRRRLAVGQDAVAPRCEATQRPDADRANGSVATAPASLPPNELDKITEAMVAQLMADPSIRLSDRGRLLLRWMHASREALNVRTEVVDAIPDHWSASVAQLARAYAGFWQELAGKLERRPATSE